MLLQTVIVFFLLQKIVNLRILILGGINLNIFEKFIKDPSGVSSVLGEVLIAGIVIITFDSLFII